MLRWAIGSGVLVALLALPAATAPSGDRLLGSGVGELTGSTPLCYGPGPDLNLQPVITVRAQRSDGLVRTLRVVNTASRHSYRLVLPAGVWTVSSFSGRVTAVVRSHQPTTADLPHAGCL